MTIVKKIILSNYLQQKIASTKVLARPYKLARLHVF